MYFDSAPYLECAERHHFSYIELKQQSNDGSNLSRRHTAEGDIQRIRISQSLCRNYSVSVLFPPFWHGPIGTEMQNGVVSHLQNKCFDSGFFNAAILAYLMIGNISIHMNYARLLWELHEHFSIRDFHEKCPVCSAITRRFSSEFHPLFNSRSAMRRPFCTHSTTHRINRLAVVCVACDLTHRMSPIKPNITI